MECALHIICRYGIRKSPLPSSFWLRLVVFFKDIYSKVSIMAVMLLAFTALAAAQVVDDSTITAAPSATSSEVLLYPFDPSATGSPCKSVICYDYINTCSIRFGGCYPACENQPRPTYTGRSCEGGVFRSSFSKSVPSIQTDPCGYKCDYSTDSCGNTFGPGCYTSCPGFTVPSYIIPICEAEATVTPPDQTVYVTPVPVTSVVALFVPLDALNKRQASETALAASASTEVAATDSAGGASYMPVSITPGGATIGAILSTLSPSTLEISEVSSSVGTVSSIPSDLASATSTTDSAIVSLSSAETLSSSDAATATSVLTTESSSVEASASDTASVLPTDTAGGLETESAASFSYTLVPITPGGATIGADLSTLSPSSVETAATESEVSASDAVTASTVIGIASTSASATATQTSFDTLTTSSDPSTTESSGIDVGTSAEASTFTPYIGPGPFTDPFVGTTLSPTPTDPSTLSPSSLEEATANLQNSSDASIATSVISATESLSADISTSSATLPFATVGPYANATISSAALPFTANATAGSYTNATTSSAAPVVLWTPEPIPEGGATIGANLATLRPTLYGYLEPNNIMDPATETGEAAAEATSNADAASVALASSATFSAPALGTTEEAIASETAPSIAEVTAATDSTEFATSSSSYTEASATTSDTTSTPSSLDVSSSVESAFDASITGTPSTADVKCLEHFGIHRKRSESIDSKRPNTGTHKFSLDHHQFRHNLVICFD
ncbi:hypothetical protein BST61_g1660 [Cercospora zeina]